MMLADWKGLLSNFECRAPADDSAIRRFEQESGDCLPEDYKQFLRHSDGGQGFVLSSAYLILWPVEQLLEMNKAYEVAEYAPGLVLFGSDGGGEALAFDMRSDAKPVVVVPFVGMDLDAIWPVAATFKSFLVIPKESWGPHVDTR
jgi:hypothetical protein